MNEHERIEELRRVLAAVLGTLDEKVRKAYPVTTEEPWDEECVGALSIGGSVGIGVKPTVREKGIAQRKVPGWAYQVSKTVTIPASHWEPEDADVVDLDVHEDVWGAVREVLDLVLDNEVEGIRCYGGVE